MISDESSSSTVLITALCEVLHFTYYSYLIDLLIFFMLRLFSVDWSDVSKTATHTETN